MGPNEQNQYFGELKQKVCLYIYGSAPKRSAKFVMQKRAFCVKKRKKLLAKLSQTGYNQNHRQLSHLAAIQTRTLVRDNTASSQ